LVLASLLLALFNNIQLNASLPVSINTSKKEFTLITVFSSDTVINYFEKREFFCKCSESDILGGIHALLLSQFNISIWPIDFQKTKFPRPQTWTFFACEKEEEGKNVTLLCERRRNQCCYF
jgi:hypothetical protein